MTSDPRAHLLSAMKQCGGRVETALGIALAGSAVALELGRDRFLLYLGLIRVGHDELYEPV